MAKTISEIIDNTSLERLWCDCCGGDYHTDAWRSRNKDVIRAGVLRKMNNLASVCWSRLKRYRDVGGIKFGRFLDLCSAVGISVYAMMPDGSKALNDENDRTVRSMLLCEYVNCMLSVGIKVFADDVEIERFTEVE